MQPVLMITSAVEGIVYINGVFTGAVRPDTPLFRPITAFGGIYIEHRPLSFGYLPLAVLIALSAGKPVPASIDAANGVCGVVWPFGIIEIELLPRKITETPPKTRLLSGAGFTFRYISYGDARSIEIETPSGAREYELPCCSQSPVLALEDRKIFISGNTEYGGRYLLALNEFATEELLRLTARDIAFQSGSKIISTEDIGGVLGRKRTTAYIWSGNECKVESVEISSSEDMAFLTPVDCALAALECFQLGDESALGGFFAPDINLSADARSMLADTNEAVKMRFTPPNGKPAIGALKLINPSLAEAICVYYRAEMLSCAWKLVELSI